MLPLVSVVITQCVVLMLGTRGSRRRSTRVFLIASAAVIQTVLVMVGLFTMKIPKT